MEIPTGVWVGSVVIIIVVCFVIFWVTKKAYSRKWEEDE